MVSKEEFKKDIMSLRKDILSLEKVIQSLVKNIESNSHIIKTTNKILNEFIEKSKNLEPISKNKPDKIKKMGKQNKEDEKYDWIEDTIGFDSK